MANNVQVSSCLIQDSFCSVQCECSKGYFGADCSIPETSSGSAVGISVFRTTRASLCFSLKKTLSLQEIDVESMSSIAIQIKSISLDATQLSTAALIDCTTALSTLITSYPNVAGDDGAIGQVLEALATLVGTGPALFSNGLSSSIEKAMTSLALGRQAALTVGEAETQFSSPSLRFSTTKVKSAALSSAPSRTVPQAPIETLFNVPGASVSINTSIGSHAESVVGVTLVQFNSNPTKALSNTTSIKVQAFFYGDEAQAVVETTSRLLNWEPIEYYSQAGSTGKAICERSRSPYNISQQCENGMIYPVVCAGDTRYIMNYSCPLTAKFPKCSTWNSNRSAFEINSDCTVVAYDERSTTCKCRMASGTLNNRRKLQQRIPVRVDTNLFSFEISSEYVYYTALFATSLRDGSSSIPVTQTVVVASAFGVLLSLMLIRYYPPINHLLNTD